MSEGADPTGEEQRIVLPKALHKGDVFDALLDEVRLVDTQTPVIFDASGVERMTTSCALLVLATARAQEAGDANTIIENPSGVFVDAFSDLGLFDQLMTLEFRT
ncbi:MAG: anti-anti-sigma factor [Pseudomonadota bacterium]